MRPLLLDLFCGAGGAAMGYYRAGFDVVGVFRVACASFSGYVQYLNNAQFYNTLDEALASVPVRR